MKYIFDIDGTICSDTKGDYFKAKPNFNRIQIINNLFEIGNEIVIFTARGMGTFDNDQIKAKGKWESFTIDQLSMWGVKYQDLIFGKPSGDYYIDDKGISDKDFFGQEL